MFLVNEVEHTECNTVIKENIAEHVSEVKAVVDDGGCFFLNITGKSMLPFLRDYSDTAVLVKKEELQKYDVAFYVRECGGVVLHRVVGIHGDSYDFCGDNQVDIEKGIPRRNVIAVMSSFRRNGKIHSCESFAYKIKSVLWVKTRIIRKFYRNLKIKIKHLVKR